MELAAIVVVLALVFYFVTAALVGRARGKYNIEAPATTGDPIFERYFRVQENTQESLMLFLPGMLLFTHYGNATVAAGLGVIWIIGRILYLRAYVKDPKSRSIGFMLSFIPNAILVIGGGVGAIRILLG